MGSHHFTVRFIEGSFRPHSYVCVLGVHKSVTLALLLRRLAHYSSELLLFYPSIGVKMQQNAV